MLSKRTRHTCLSYARQLFDRVIWLCIKIKRQSLFKKQLHSLCTVVFFLEKIATKEIMYEREKFVFATDCIKVVSWSK